MLCRSVKQVQVQIGSVCFCATTSADQTAMQSACVPLAAAAAAEAALPAAAAAAAAEPPPPAITA